MTAPGFEKPGLLALYPKKEKSEMEKIYNPPYVKKTEYNAPLKTFKGNFRTRLQDEFQIRREKNRLKIRTYFNLDRIYWQWHATLTFPIKQWENSQIRKMISRFCHAIDKKYKVALMAFAIIIFDKNKSPYTHVILANSHCYKPCLKDLLDLDHSIVIKDLWPYNGVITTSNKWNQEQIINFILKPSTLILDSFDKSHFDIYYS
ncbi:uncharacterized protein Dvar_40950 [Desulfosarcina variabilis str. Montpellier]|uniref:hypothetical protein n=1 Tax=Desulfosarcina variabilis TaxID=2300 RepID=UPI003AFB74DE